MAADPFDFRDQDLDEPRSARRPPSNAPFLAALVGIGLLVLLVVAGGVGYFVWRDVQVKQQDTHDRAEIERLQLAYQRAADDLAAAAGAAYDRGRPYPHEEKFKTDGIDLSTRFALRLIDQGEYDRRFQEMDAEVGRAMRRRLRTVQFEDATCRQIRGAMDKLRGEHQAVLALHPGWNVQPLPPSD